MITLIEVDGFKSLRDFSLSLHEGLNVLVGPNGAGKTNIVQYFEFLSSCMENGVSRTVSQFGGAGVVFRKVGEVNWVNKICSKVYGSVQMNEEFIYYELLFDITLSEARDKVYISRQCINVQIQDSHTKGKISESDKNFDFELDLVSPNSTDLVLKEFAYSEKIGNKMPWLHIFGPPEREKVSGKELTSLFTTDEFSISNPVFHEEYISEVRYELEVGIIYNFDPEAIRKPSNGVSEPVIEKDGSGVYSTLYAITSNSNSQRMDLQENPPSNEKRCRKVSKGLCMDTVLEHVRLVNDSIENISVEDDPYNNQLRIKVTVLSGEEEATILPFSSLSDGTVKWISLVTLILTNPSITCIEELENHLHPTMQSIFVEIIRDNQSAKPASTILTTHSESLLNALFPGEVVCVKFEEGRTIASRPSNKDAIQDEMNRTGFGLGYYYATGELDI